MTAQAPPGPTGTTSTAGIVQAGNISVRFEHYVHQFEEVEFSRYLCPHFSDKEAGEILAERYLACREAPQHGARLLFQRNQIICANEVYAESALADPIADLEVWDEWRNEKRSFPFPGLYVRLGLTKQKQKVGSTTSIGVIGEVFTGLLAQSFIAPCVVVRPIRRWPDLVFLRASGRYARVESKAYAPPDDSEEETLEQIRGRLLRKNLLLAARDLSSDPSGEVWLSFTEICNISPLHVFITMIELHPPAGRRPPNARPNVPQPVIDGLAEQAMARAAARTVGRPRGFESDEHWPGDKPACYVADEDAQEPPLDGFKDQEERHWLKRAAIEEIDAVMVDTVPENLRDEVHGFIKDIIEKRLKKPVYISKAGRRLRMAKATAVAGRLAPVRSTDSGDKPIFIADLLDEARSRLRARWQPDWEQANQPWGYVDQSPLWRCSSVVVTRGPADLQGRDVNAESA